MIDLRKRLHELTKSKTLFNASYFVYSQVTYYPQYDKVYLPFKPKKKLLPGIQRNQSTRISEKDTQNNTSNTSNEDNIERSIRRTKKVIKDYVLCNQFDMFATFTFKDARQDIDKCKSRMSTWLKNQQKRKGKFEYLIVPEFHKDGASLHFHALIKNYPGKIVEAINPKTEKPLVQKGRKVYSFASYKLGFSNVIKIDADPESHEKVGNYVRKYITKDMPMFFGKNRYWSSSGLVLPIVQDNPPDSVLERKPIRKYQNEYGIILYFEKSNPRIVM